MEKPWECCLRLVPMSGLVELEKWVEENIAQEGYMPFPSDLLTDINNIARADYLKQQRKPMLIRFHTHIRRLVAESSGSGASG